MGRKPLINFNDIFGEFNAEGVGIRPTKVYKIEDKGKVHRCNKCGGNPRVHDICLISQETKNKKHIYIDCDGCGECSGEIYEMIEDAISDWNDENPKEEVPLNTERKEYLDFIRSVVD